jgi:hypothetical protein
VETRKTTDSRGALHGPEDIQEARLRDAVGRLQVLLLRDLVGQYEADERDLELPSTHRGWLSEDVLVSRALGIYGPNASPSPSERALVIGVLEDLRRQRFVDRLDLDGGNRRAWRLRRQNDEIIEIATRFVDEYKWVPPVVDVAGIIQAVSAVAGTERPQELPAPSSDVSPGHER